LCLDNAKIGSFPGKPSHFRAGDFEQADAVAWHSIPATDTSRSLRSPFEIDDPENVSDVQEPRTYEADQDGQDPPSPTSDKEEAEPQAFRRWVSTLRRRKAHQPEALAPRKDRWTLDDFDVVPEKKMNPERSHHRASHSHSSSLAFVTAVKSATVTLASVSIAAISRRGRGAHLGFDRGFKSPDRSFMSPDRDLRTSIDGAFSATDVLARQRGRKRREKIEELIRTEESYVADLKALSDVSTCSHLLSFTMMTDVTAQAYFTILVNQTTSASYVRHTAQKTISELLRLHNDILGELHAVVPFAEYDQSTAKTKASFSTSHNRWHSIDVVPTRSRSAKHMREVIRQGRRSLNIARSTEEEHPLLQCSPQIAAKVAETFLRQVRKVKALFIFVIDKFVSYINSKYTGSTAPVMKLCNATLTSSSKLLPLGLNSTKRSKFSPLM
jgi:hypothetical protein